MEEKEINYDEAPECKKNDGVGCFDQTKCKSCGFNPVVARERIVRKYGVQHIDALTQG